jgi:hypothetical protein
MTREQAYKRLMWRIAGRPVMQLDRSKVRAILKTWKPFLIEKPK